MSACPWSEINSIPADVSFSLWLKNEQVVWCQLYGSSPVPASRLSTELSHLFVDRCEGTPSSVRCGG